jgi:autotransporter adhesin
MNGGAAFGDNSSATGSLATAIGPGAVASAANSTAIGAGSVANQPNTVSVGTPGNLRQITNVADGTGPNDALTVEQGQAIGASAVAQANAFTDSRFNQLSNTVQTVSKRADAAVASAIASSDLPQPIHPGHGELAIGVGGFNGQAGLAVGASFRFKDDRTSIRGSVNVTDEGEAGGGAAIGFEF